MFKSMKKHKKAHVLILLFVTLVSCKKNITTKKIDENKIVTKFNYSPKKPINGKLYGVVELGAAGFNSFIACVDENQNWELKKVEYGTSLLVEGMTNTMLVSQKLKQYIDRLVDFDVAEEDIYFVVSSGAIKEDITKLIIKELNSLGCKVNTVTPSEEGKYALLGVLPKEFKRNSFVVDMGSGNTKISYLSEDDSANTIEVFGAKYYQKGFEDKEVYNKVRNEISKLPENRKYKCFIIGGVPYEMATSVVGKEKIDLFTVLNANINVYPKGKGKKFQSGLNIFKAIQDETKVKQTIYLHNGNFAIGFLLAEIAKE